MAALLQDLRFGFRMLFKNPTLSLITILTLGIGIGLTTTIFSIVNGAILRGLPFPDADRIVAVSRSNPSQNIENMDLSVHDFAEWREQQTVLEELGAWDTWAVNLSAESGRPERYQGALVTANVFRILGVEAVQGRVFREGDDRPGEDQLLLLGYDVWQNQFGGSPSVIGKTVRVNGGTRTIIGVTPDGFGFPANHQVWAPMVVNPAAYARGQGPGIVGVGRRKSGISLEQSQAAFAVIAGRLAQAYPETNKDLGANVVPFMRRIIGGEIWPLLYTMLGAVIGVLLIACANVANLLLARTSARMREVAVRTALGASRARIVVQMVAEVLVLSLGGAVIGIGLGYVGIALFDRAVASNPPPFWMDFAPDGRVLLFVAAATLLSAFVAGVFPALQATGPGVSEVLKDESRGSSSLHIGKFSGVLVVAEVTLSCGLLIASGLMIKSVAQLRNVDLPFETSNILTARINLPETEYPDAASRIRFYDQLEPRLAGLPGIAGATLSDGLPASGNGTRTFEVEGKSYAQDRDYPSAREGIVTPGYFHTFDAPVRSGRVFTGQDREKDLPVAVINETFARTLFPGVDPLGRRMRMGRRDTTARWLTVIGVVPDMRMEGIGNNNASPAGFYIPISQSSVGNFVSIAVRTAGPPLGRVDAIRSAVTSLDPNLAIFNVLTMEGVIAQQTWFYRIFGVLFMIFGFVALFLAAVGLYGVMSFAVARRTQEMGIRLALGARPEGLVGLVMKRGMLQLALGIVLGLALAAIASAPLQIVLFEVNARDPLVFGLVVGSLALTGILASLVPARRVARVDPVVALAAD